MPHVELPHGTVHYCQPGAGAPVVLLHGYLMGAHLWDPVVHRLEGEFRCLVPELPFGAHPAPMRPGADLTAAGLGRLAADFLDALDLRDVTLVGNDSRAAAATLEPRSIPLHTTPHLDERLRRPSGIRSLTLGDTKLSYVPDGVGTLNARLLLPEPADEDWAQHPEYLDEGGHLVTGNGGLLVEHDGRALLIDAGMGPVTAGPPLNPFGTVSGGKLLDSLATLGRNPAGIEAVALTHLHHDHFGWAWHPAPGSGRDAHEVAVGSQIITVPVMLTIKDAACSWRVTRNTPSGAGHCAACPQCPDAAAGIPCPPVPHARQRQPGPLHDHRVRQAPAASGTTRARRASAAGPDRAEAIFRSSSSSPGRRASGAATRMPIVSNEKKLFLAQY